MIGNSYRYRDTGYSILEEGDLAPPSYQLRVTRYLIANPNGDVIANADTMGQARQWLAEYLSRVEKSGK